MRVSCLGEHLCVGHGCVCSSVSVGIIVHFWCARTRVACCCAFDPIVVLVANASWAEIVCKVGLTTCRHMPLANTDARRLLPALSGCDGSQLHS